MTAPITFVKNPERIKIGLMTPYTGGNLGDGAIQNAVIQSVIRYCPGAEIWGITLFPEDTETRHHIRSFPISGEVMKGKRGRPSSGSSSITSKEAIQDLTVRDPGVAGSAKQSSLGLASSGFLRAIRAGKSVLRPVKRTVLLIARDVSHIIGAYRLSRELRYLIASGGGQLDDYWGGPWGHPYALFKWAVISRLTRTRLIFMSVGTCTLSSRLSLFFVKGALRLARYRSYRDYTSKQLLTDMPFTRQDPVFPDLAFSYNPPESKAESHDPGLVVGISPIAYLSGYGWPKENLIFFEEYVQKLIAFASDLIERGYSILLFATATVDNQVIEQILKVLRRAFPVGHDGQVNKVRLRTVEDLFAWLPKVDFVVASRLHGVLLSHLANRPVLAISYDRKVDTYMADVGQSKYCLNIHDLDLNLLEERFRTIEAEAKSLKTKLEDTVRGYRVLLEDQYAGIFGEHPEGGSCRTSGVRWQN